MILRIHGYFSPEWCLKMQMSWPYPKLTELKFLGVRWRNLHINLLLGWNPCLCAGGCPAGLPGCVRSAACPSGWSSRTSTKQMSFFYTFWAALDPLLPCWTLGRWVQAGALSQIPIAVGLPGREPCWFSTLGILEACLSGAGLEMPFLADPTPCSSGRSSGFEFLRCVGCVSQCGVMSQPLLPSSCGLSLSGLTCSCSASFHVPPRPTGPCSVYICDLVCLWEELNSEPFMSASWTGTPPFLLFLTSFQKEFANIHAYINIHVLFNSIKK